jgi:hypothetical protein
MTDLKKDLKVLKFFRKGTIELEKGNKYPVFKGIIKEREEGNVYMWIVENRGNPSQILYIGKAGTTIFQRCKEHLRGFSGASKSKRGLINGTDISKLLKKGKKIVVYGRHSAQRKILGQEKISLCAAEENALIARYRQNHVLLNRLKKLKLQVDKIFTGP